MAMFPVVRGNRRAESGFQQAWQRRGSSHDRIQAPAKNVTDGKGQPVMRLDLLGGSVGFRFRPNPKLVAVDDELLSVVSGREGAEPQRLR